MIVHEIVSPYRAPLFAALSRHPALDVTVVLVSKSEPRRAWSVDLTALPYRWVMVRSHMIAIPGDEPQAWFVPRGLLRTLSRLDPEVVVVGGYANLAAIASMNWARARGRKLLLWSESIRDHRKGLLRRAKRQLVGMCDGYLVPGSLAADHLVALGAPPSAVTIMPNCIDLDLFRCDDPSETVVRRILLCGLLTERKNPLGAVRAVAEADVERRVTLVVVGGGALSASVRATAHRLGVSIEMHGHVDYPDLPAVFRTCDAFIFPTQADVWGFVLNEAAATGLPIVASSAAGGAPDLVDEGTSGWVVPPTLDGLTSGVRQLLSLSGIERVAMVRASRFAAERCSVARAVDGFLEATGAARSSGPTAS